MMKRYSWFIIMIGCATIWSSIVSCTDDEHLNEIAQILASLNAAEFEEEPSVAASASALDLDEQMYELAEAYQADLEKVKSVKASAVFLPERLYMSETAADHDETIEFVSEIPVAWPSNTYLTLYESKKQAGSMIQQDWIELTLERTRGPCDLAVWLLPEGGVGGGMVRNQPNRFFYVTHTTRRLITIRLDPSELNAWYSVGDKHILQIPPRCSVRLIKATRSIPQSTNPKLCASIRSETSASKVSLRDGLRRRKIEPKLATLSLFGHRIQYL